MTSDKLHDSTRIKQLEAELAAIREELTPPPEWPLHLAARAAKDALARREAVIAGLVEALKKLDVGEGWAAQIARAALAAAKEATNDQA